MWRESFIKGARTEEAMVYYQQSLDISAKLNIGLVESRSLYSMGNIYMGQKMYADAEHCFEGAAYSQSLQARCLFYLGYYEKARKLSMQAIEFLEEYDPEKVDREVEPEQILFTHHLVMQQQNDSSADEYLRGAYKILKEKTRKVTDPGKRTIVFDKAPNRSIGEAWESRVK
jgi:tetratricopeptide (TPR) repeat protein